MSKTTFVFKHIDEQSYHLKQKKTDAPSYTSFDGCMGGIFWPLAKHHQFLELCAKDLFAKNSLYLNEYAACSKTKMFLDIDFALLTDDYPNLEHKSGAILISNLIRYAQDSVSDFFDFLKVSDTKLAIADRRFKLVVVQRKKLLKMKNEKQIVSVGYHFHWPNLTVSYEAAIAIRSRLLWYVTVQNPHIFPQPSTEGWEDIIDEKVFAGNPHLRCGLSEKCQPCLCTKKMACFHGAKRRTNVPGSAYNSIVGVFDHEYNRYRDEEKRLSPIDENGAQTEKAILLFLKATSIRTDDAIQHHTVPADFVPDCFMTMTKKKKLKRFDQLNTLDTETKEGKTRALRFQLVYNWIELVFNLPGELASIQDLQYDGKPGHEFYSITTNSRYCPNAGMDHSSSNGHVTVSTYPGVMSWKLSFVSVIVVVLQGHWEETQTPPLSPFREKKLFGVWKYPENVSSMLVFATRRAVLSQNTPVRVLQGKSCC